MRPSAPLLTAAAVSAVALLAGCATTEPEPDRRPAGVPSAGQGPIDSMKGLEKGEPTPYAEITDGMCSNQQTNVGAKDPVSVVDCSRPHRFEVISKITLPDSAQAEFPGEAGMRTKVRDACEPHFKNVLQSSEETRYRYYLVPFDKASWESGNRIFYCAVTFSKPKTGALSAASAQGDR
ncbi:septum formation family protein [Streptomyces sp. NPDC091040]|uniref:septum formation family protein n=1 Tax=Streptomyces sp. NPDC091040 TaxID=3365972 RepID=UPI00380CBA4C